MSRSGWHNLHLTRGRAEAIARATLGVIAPGLRVGDDMFERAMQAALAAAQAVTYSPQVRGAMGGHAKHGTRPGERPRQEEARAARREQARQRRLEEEYRIGKVPVGRAVRLGGDSYWAEEKEGR